MLCWDDGIFVDLNDVLVSCDYDVVLVLSFLSGFWMLGWFIFDCFVIRLFCSGLFMMQFWDWLRLCRSDAKGIGFCWG